MDYFRFNQELDEYLNRHKYSFYLYTLKSNIEFLKEAKKRINPFKIIGSNSILLKYDQFISGMKTIDLVTSFLDSLGGEYCSYFDKSFRNGTFGFCNSSEQANQKWGNYSYINGDNKLYDVLLNNNIADGKNIIHEFFHYLNLDAYRSSAVFSELISIYMENKYLDFLSQNGYSKKDIATSKLFRYLDYNVVCTNLYQESLILMLKEKIGYIDEDSYQFITDYKEQLSFPEMSKKEYISLLKNIASNIRLTNNDNSVKFKPDISYRYFFGTVYSSCLLNNPDSLEDVLLLNKCLMYNKETEIFKGFELLGIDDLLFDDAIKMTNDYYKPSIITYKNSRVNIKKYNIGNKKN